MVTDPARGKNSAMREFLFAAGLGVLAAGTGLATGVAAAPPAPDQDFAAQVYQANVDEIREARLALSDSRNSAVDGFAQMMIDDHSTANVELAAAARRAGIPLPQDEGPAPPDPHMTRLSDAAAGGDFNQRYFSEQVGEHEQALALLRTEADKGSSPEMRAFAEQLVPIVQRHLDEARAALASLALAAPKRSGAAGAATYQGGSIDSGSGTQPLSGTPALNPAASPGASASPGPAATGQGAVPAPTNTPNHP